MTPPSEAGRPPILRTLRVLCGVTAAYDIALGCGLIFLLKTVGALLNLETPTYPDNAQLNGAFLIAVGIGYVIVLGRLEATLWYLWVMGVLLHLAGAGILFYNIIASGSPWQFGVFGGVDGVLGVLFLINLTKLQRQGM